jgi:gluconate kinase
LSAEQATTMPVVRFVFLDASRALLEARVANRPTHFMPASLLDSQLASLEPLAPDEPGITVAPDLRSVDLVAALA